MIIVRSPLPEKQAAVSREMEAKKRPVEQILTDLVIDSTIDPAPLDVEAGAVLRAFFGAYPGAGANAGNIVLELGGLRQKADKGDIPAMLELANRRVTRRLTQAEKVQYLP